MAWLGGLDAGANDGEKLRRCVSEAAARGMLLSSHCCEGVGLAVTLARACARHGRGASLSIDALAAAGDARAVLFGAEPSQWVVCLPKEEIDPLSALASAYGVTLCCLGMVAGERLIVSDARRVWIDWPVREGA